MRPARKRSARMATTSLSLSARMIFTPATSGSVVEMTFMSASMRRVAVWKRSVASEASWYITRWNGRVTPILAM